MKSERVLAALIVDYYMAQGFTVHQEVQCWGKVADIVLRAGKMIWVVECKLSMNLEVIGQADFWKEHAHKVSVAVPYIKDSAKARGAERCCRALGIGIIQVTGEPEPRVNRETVPEFRRKILPHLAKVLEKHQNLIDAGTNKGGYWTPFKDTCDNLRTHVRENPGADLGATLKIIEHHYASAASARGALANLILDDKVPGLRIERDGKRLRLYAEAKS